MLKGDLYCCVERITPFSFFNGHDPEAITAAVEGGAAAILAQVGVNFPDGLVPDHVPVVYAANVDELAARLAAVFYGEASTGGRRHIWAMGFATSLLVIDA